MWLHENKIDLVCINPLIVFGVKRRVNVTQRTASLLSWWWKLCALRMFFCQSYTMTVSLNWKDGQILDKNLLHSAGARQTHHGQVQ